MRNIMLIALWASACHKDKDHDTTVTGGGDDSAATDSGDDTGEPVGCQEDVGDSLPTGAEWIELDGGSTQVFTFADGLFPTDWEGSYGTYDLNTEEVYGANGFKLERPGQVVGVQVQWGNLGADEQAATVQVWPDFGSDGYIFDVENPYESATRCLTSDDEGDWIEYVLPEPFRVEQPLHVFAGYHRGTLEEAPEIFMENFMQEGEPYFAGVRWSDVDDEGYYLGMSSPWYTWRVRLAVVYDDAIPDADKPFQIDDALSASSRVAWGDYDGDGDDDLMTNGPTLYRNEGDGSFTLVDDLPATDPTNGGVWGDYDNDGCLDFFGQGTSYTAMDVLLHNECDGTFTDATLSSGINDLQSTRDCDGDGEAEYSPTEGSGWFDVDNDGWIDLYMANYECSSDYDYYKNYDDRLWRNNGDGTFTEWTEHSGIPTSNQAGRGVTTGDYDQDGDIDVFVSNYRLDPDFFLLNNGDGTVSDIASSNGTRGEYEQGAYGHTIGSVFGDIDNDGDFDLIQANLAHPFWSQFSDKSMVLMNDGVGQFTDEAAERGIYYRETASNPTLFDADNDGDLDLFITNVYTGRDSDFYLNDGSGDFTLTNYESGLVRQNGWGAAAADFDLDGDVDLVAYDLFRNDTADAGHWLEVRPIGGAPEGGACNRAGIGAVVQISAGGTSQLRQVSGGSGTGVQDSMTLHFGLGSAEQVDSLRVLFPGGAEVTLSDVAADERLWVHEDGRTSTEVPAW